MFMKERLCSPFNKFFYDTLKGSRGEKRRAFLSPQSAVKNNVKCFVVKNMNIIPNDKVNHSKYKTIARNVVSCMENV